MNRTKGLNPISPKRLASLAAAGITHPSTTFASPTKPAAVKAKAAKKPADTGPDQATVDRALQRDHWSCTVCGDPLRGDRGSEWSVHHRKLRSQGGDNRLSNLISVCGHGCSQCHGALHGGPTAARKGGWMLRSTDVPEEFRMAHSQHGWVLLDNEGEWARTKPPAEDTEPEGEPF